MAAKNAAIEGNVECLWLLLKNNSCERSPFKSTDKYDQCLELIINNLATTHYKKLAVGIALSLATYLGKTADLKMLIDTYDVSIEDRINAASYAAQNKKECLQILCNGSFDKALAMNLAIEKNLEEYFQILLKNSFIEDRRDSALHAARHNNHQILQKVINAGLSELDREHALQLSARHGCLDCLQLLVQSEPITEHDMNLAIEEGTEACRNFLIKKREENIRICATLSRIFQIYQFAVSILSK